MLIGSSDPGNAAQLAYLLAPFLALQILFYKMPDQKIRHRFSSFRCIDSELFYYTNFIDQMQRSA